MREFQAYAANFELFPQSGEAFQHLFLLLEPLKRLDFTFRVNDPEVNQGQMISDFDNVLENTLLKNGATHYDLQLPSEIPQEFDFAFEYHGRKVAVEIEKSNREKILRDILKCHMYLHAGVDYTLVGLPRNYAHSHGIWDLYQEGVQRLTECLQYGFGTPDKLNKVLLLGFTQYDTISNEPLNPNIRKQMREKAKES
jgi:hypothetical protein